MEDSHATVLDLRKGKTQIGDETDVAKSEKDKSEANLTPTPAGDRVSFFAVYDGHGGKFIFLFHGCHKLIRM